MENPDDGHERAQHETARSCGATKTAVLHHQSAPPRDEPLGPAWDNTDDEWDEIDASSDISALANSFEDCEDDEDDEEETTIDGDDSTQCAETSLPSSITSNESTTHDPSLSELTENSSTCSSNWTLLTTNASAHCKTTEQTKHPHKMMKKMKH